MEYPPFYSANRGDADLLPNGNILITDAINERIFEVDYATKDVVWEYHIRGATTYKAQRIDSWPPRPVVD